MLEIKNVTKKYSNKVALKNISLKLNDGEIFGFIGHNGAGKTTLIKAIVGIHSFDEGNILIDGLSIMEDELEYKKKIAYIPDNPDLYENLKGIDYLNFIADIYKVPVTIRKKRIKLFGERFGLSDVLDKPMQGYSHGTRQKMMVVAALVHDPAVWILDEPLIGLDPTSAFELKKMMREHADKGNAVFFSTHVLEVAEKLCDRIAIIDKGKIVFVGTLKELKDKYDKKDLEKLFMEVIKND